MPILTSGRYAAVASTLALVVALGGASYAAVSITGKDIQDNTVTTKDIKNKTLKVKDFSPKAKKSLTGATGPAGPAGPAGPTGPTGATGPIGPSNAFAVFNNTSTVLTNSYKSVLTLPLQPGSYLVTSKVFGHRTSTGALAYVYCRLSFGTTTDFTGADEPDVAGAYSNVTNQITFTTATAGNAVLDCLGVSSNVDYKRLTAIQVGSATVTQGPNVARPAIEPKGR